MVRTLVYMMVCWLCWLYLWLHNRLRIEGRELVPSQGRLILAANHTSNLDPIVAGIAFPHRLRPLAKEELFQINPVFTWLIRTLGAIPVSRETNQASSAALKNFLALLQQGENLMIFPEGARSLDGRLAALEGGVALVAVREQVPIVPLYIAGTFEAMPVGTSKIGRHQIVARFGNPIVPQGNAKGERERVLKALEDELQRLEQFSLQS